MTAQVTHVVVRDTPPPSHVMTVGHLYPVGQQTVFKTVAPVFTSDEEDVDAKDVDEAETKVVRKGRRPQPPATEGVETK